MPHFFTDDNLITTLSSGHIKLHRSTTHYFFYSDGSQKGPMK